MALYRNHGENTPLLGRIKLGTTELSNGCWGHTFMLLCLSLGLGVVLAPKLHKYGNKKEGKKNEENNSYHRRVQPAFERAG